MDQLLDEAVDEAPVAGGRAPWPAERAVTA